MAAKKGQGVAAGQYAKALLELAGDRGQAEAMSQELQDLRRIIEGNPGFGAFLADPGISQEERRGVLERVLGGVISPLLMNGVRVLMAKGRLGLLPEIAEQYGSMLDEQLGNLEVEVTVATAMDAAMLRRVEGRISESLRRNAKVSQLVDESIIGGMIVKVEDRLIDGSAKAQLAAMKRQLMAAAAKA